MATRLRAAVAAPGIAWGLYPQRNDSGADRTPLAERLRKRLGGERRYREIAQAAARAASAWEALAPAAYSDRLAELRGRMRRGGLTGEAVTDALGCTADAGRRALGVRLHPSQLFAAAVLLDGCLAEMATGEGKTYAAAAAGAAAALAGIPVHVMTANDYLVERDAASLAPWYAVLGLTTGSVLTAQQPELRREQYRADIVYCTARELVFDYLRDGLEQPARHELLHRAAALARQPSRPRLRGLCMAILDEADNVLLDEAVTPLVLARSQSDPQRRAFLWQALQLARALDAPEDFRTDTAVRRATLSERGRERLQALSAPLGAPWRQQRRGEEAVATALAALHLYRRDRDYLVEDARVVIVDPHTGRGAPGRAWSQGLHGCVELKEGLAPSAETQPIAQITYQRFFPRYLRLCGMSGTLKEARRELRSVYGLAVIEVPLRGPSRRQQLPARLMAPGDARWEPVVARVRELHRSRRPILIGTDSVADSEALAAGLADAGIAHSVLNARRHREESAVVARAGLAGTVTIATHMAGRGTDIVLDAGSRALGGLHVMSCQDAAPRRLERQLAGRCARQDDPGSFERWFAPERPQRGERASILCSLVRYQEADANTDRLQGLLRFWLLARQRAEERRCAEQRRQVLRRDREWARCCSFTSAAE